MQAEGAGAADAVAHAEGEKDAMADALADHVA